MATVERQSGVMKTSTPLFLVLAGCFGGYIEPSPTPPPIPDVLPSPAPTPASAAVEIDEELERANGTKPYYLALAEPAGPPREVPSDDEIGASLHGGRLQHLREALAATGMDEAEMVVFVARASLHNSGQPGDPVAALADRWRSSLRGAVDEFNEHLEQAEAEQGVVVDRGQLSRLGVVLSFDRQEVQ